MKVLICSGNRGESQANIQVRTSITKGWGQLIGPENVVATNPTGATTAIAGFRPNVVLGIGSYLPESTYFGEIARDTREIGAVPIFWATEDPYEQDAQYRIIQDFDVIFSCDHWGTNFYTHPRAWHLPLAGCRELHFNPYNPIAERSIDVMFCGVAFSSRKEIVHDIMPALSGLNVRFIGPGWGEFGAGFSDRRIDKSELLHLYAKSKIVLNLGRSLHFENRRYLIVPSSPGPRTFEVALAGALQLFHEDTYEIRKYFSADEVPAFSTQNDFRDLLHNFLDNPAQREKFALKAQTRALAEHTYAHRAKRVLEVLGEEDLL